MEQLLARRLTGLQGYLPRPFWGITGILSVLCGVFASDQVRWDGEGVLTLVLVLLLTNLAWGSVWNLAVGTDWFCPLAGGWSRSRPVPWMVLPYTRPESPGGRFLRWLGRLAAWWQEEFWPVVGPAVVGMLTAVVLSVVLIVILPNRLRPLGTVLVALLGLGIVQRWRGRILLTAQSLVKIGLGWLAGHAAFAEVSVVSLAVALCVVLSASGALWVGEGLAGGLWLLNGGQLAVAVLMVVLKQPLAAGAVGLLLFGQVGMQLSLRTGSDPASISRRMWPWLLISMLVAALAIR